MFPRIETLHKIGVHKWPTQDDEGRAKVGYQLSINISHRRRKFLLIFHLFMTPNKWKIYFGADAKRHRHAMSTTGNQCLDSAPMLKTWNTLCRSLRSKPLALAPISESRTASRKDVYPAQHISLEMAEDDKIWSYLKKTAKIQTSLEVTEKWKLN